ncbi:MAG: PhoH family protein [Saprospiraceae bacterium]
MELLFRNNLNPKHIKTEAISEILLNFDGIDPVELLGEHNTKLNLLKKAFPDIKIVSRGDSIKLVGDKRQTQKAKAKFEWMMRWLKENNTLPVQVVADLMSGSNYFENQIESEPNLSNNAGGNVIVHGKTGLPIKARTRNQKLLVEASEHNDIVFAVGPAGTGKTYTAVALAVKALKNKTVKKIILTRPAVEAGESLGFLPGDLKEKVDPYLRPLYDALDDMIPADKLAQFMTTRIIEVAPLAFMRGRTLDNAFIILDEAQNCTTLQLKMFLTRLGPSAKCIVTGDMTQIDLPFSQKSGLKRAIDILQNTDGIATIHLDEEDVVRHRLVKAIIKAYNDSDERIAQERDQSPSTYHSGRPARRPRREEEEIQPPVRNEEE